MHVKIKDFFMSASYRTKPAPALPVLAGFTGALLPWMLEWQFRQARAKKRLLGDAGSPVSRDPVNAVSALYLVPGWRVASWHP
jgi:hypothetical protein